MMEKYSASDENVIYMSGCIKSEEPIKETIMCEARNGSLVVRLNNNEDTIDAWFKRNGDDVKNGFILDFYGGGIPDMVKNG